MPSIKRAVAIGIATPAFIALGSVAYAAHQFPDVPDSHPFHDDISWMADVDVTDGYTDGTFRPADPVSRQSMSAFLRRLAGADPAVEPMVDAAELAGRTPADYDDAVTLGGQTANQLLPQPYLSMVNTNVALPNNYYPVNELVLPAGRYLVQVEVGLTNGSGAYGHVNCHLQVADEVIGQEEPLETIYWRDDADDTHASDDSHLVDVAASYLVTQDTTGEVELACQEIEAGQNVEVYFSQLLATEVAP